MSIFLLHPGMLWTAGLGALAVVLHLLLPRWKRRVVPSLVIWRRVAAQGLGRSARRLHADVVVVLAACAAACLVLASADPRAVRERRTGGQTVILVDNGTASLTEARTAADRLGAYVARARAAIAGPGAGGRVAVVVSSPSPGVVCPLGDASEAARALGRVGGAQTSGDLAEALALALSLGADPEVIVFGDRPLPVNSPRVRREAAGEPSRNLAIVRAEVSPAAAFCALRNFSAHEVATAVVWRALEPGPVREIARAEVTVPADGRVDVVLRPGATDGIGDAEVVAISHSHAGDDLRVDDEVWAARLRGPARRVGIVGDPGERLARALWAARARTEALGEEAALDDIDFVVYAGVTPAAWPPAVPSLLVAPPRSCGEVEILGERLADVVAGFVRTQDPTSPAYGMPQAASWTVATARRARFFGGHDPLVAAGAEVLAARLRAGEAAHVYLGFRPDDSDWAARASFPVFVARVLEAAGSGPGGGAWGFALVGGTAEALVPHDVTTLESPRGGEITRGTRLPAAGLYRYAGRARDVRRALGVNLVSEAESDNRPAPAAGATGARGQEPVPSKRFEARTLAGGLCALAAALLAAEWILSARRE